mgnify:CR=1 FL=1
MVDRSRTEREIEATMVREPGAMSYGEYLDLDRLLAAQRPVADPPCHDELLFIVQHQTSELWMKLIVHELTAVLDRLATDEVRPALKGIARIKAIQETMTKQWDVLATLTPSEYGVLRPSLGSSSGFQSFQYRTIEFLLGNRSPDVLRYYTPEESVLLRAALERRSLYDEFLHLLARHGHDVPAAILDRDPTGGHRYEASLVPVFHRIYSDPAEHWMAYETCEELVDLEDRFQHWRFRHLKTVERIIGSTLPGTGGSSGVAFLRGALDLSFFPELYAVRSQLAAGT